MNDSSRLNITTDLNAASTEPVETVIENGPALDRRGFFRLAMLGVGACYAAAIGYPVYKYLTATAEKAAAESAVTQISLTKADELPAGTAMMFEFGSSPAMLIHHRDNSWVALDAVCTHLGCTVKYQPDRNVIHCNCHGGEYNAETGANISGPPPRPLRRYTVKVSPGSVLVSRA